MDWNSDGKKDLVIGEGAGFVRIYLNTNTDANPVFTGFVYVQVGGSNYDIGNYSSPYVVDWNGDGKKDVLIGSETGTVALLINTGTDANPTFTSTAWVQDGGANLDVGSSSSPLAADWNGDGKKDLLVGELNGNIFFFENVGTNAAPVFDGSEKLAADGTLIDVGTYSRFDLCDWDEDGLQDLLCGFYNYSCPAPGGILYFHRAWFYYPDLYVDSFSAPAEVEPGDNVSTLIDLVIGNCGEIDSTSFSSKLYISEDENIGTGDDLLVEGEVVIPPIQAGSIHDVVFNSGMSIPSDIVMGQYYLGVIVDTGKQVNELDEDNNIAVLPIKIGDPPVPDVKINGNDGPLTIPSTQSVQLTIGLDPGSLLGDTQDWWITATKSGGPVFSWVFSDPLHWTLGINRAWYGPLFQINQYTIHQGKIPLGSWTILYAVDKPDHIMQKTYKDEILVTVY